MKISDIHSAIKAYREATNNDVVSPETIRYRTNICRNCPKRQFVSGFRGRASAILGSVVNKHRVKDEISKFQCSCCGCSMLLLLPAKPESLHKDSPEERAARPDACWMKTLDSPSSKQ